MSQISSFPPRHGIRSRGCGSRGGCRPPPSVGRTRRARRQRRARQLLGTDVSYLTLQRQRPPRHLHADDRRLGVGALPGVAAADGLRARWPGRADRPRPTRRPATSPTPASGTPARSTTASARKGWSRSSASPIRGSQVIGVLYAADRSERAFDRSEVALLGLPRRRTRRSRWTTPGCSRRPARPWTSCRRPAASCGRTPRRSSARPVRTTGSSTSSCAAAVSRTSPSRSPRPWAARITVLDEEGRPTPRPGRREECYGCPPDPAGAADPRAVDGPDGPRRAAGGPPRSPWTASSSGGLVLQRDAGLSDADQRILERAALVTALLLLIRRTAGEAESRVRGELLEELRASASATPRACASAPAGWERTSTSRCAVVVARIEERCDGRALAGATHLAATRGGLAALHDGCVVLCLPDLAPPPRQHRAARARVSRGGAGDRGRRRAGARPGRGRRRVLRGGPLRGHARGAGPDRRLGRRRRSSGSSACCVGEGRDVRGFVEATLAPVLEYDARRGTDLVATLRAYFDGRRLPRPGGRGRCRSTSTRSPNGWSGSAGCIGKEWSTPERALEIQLALRLHRLTGAFPG